MLNIPTGITEITAFSSAIGAETIALISFLAGVLLKHQLDLKCKRREEFNKVADSIDSKILVHGNFVKIRLTEVDIKFFYRYAGWFRSKLFQYAYSRLKEEKRLISMNDHPGFTEIRASRRKINRLASIMKFQTRRK